MNKKSAIQGSALAGLMLICGALWYRNANSAGASSDHEVKSGAAYKPMSVEKIQSFFSRGWQWPTREMWMS